MFDWKEDFPEEVAALERKHDGRYLTLNELRDILNEDTEVMFCGGAYLAIGGRWYEVSRTDLMDRVWTRPIHEDDEETPSDRLREWIALAEQARGAIFSRTDGLIFIDSLTDG